MEWGLVRGRRETGADRNEAALQLWYGWLNQGSRLVATAGTDVHGPGAQYESMRSGFNAVYADQLSEGGILRGVAAGHLYLSAGPKPQLYGRATSSGAQGMVGDSLAAPDGSASVLLAVSWDRPEPASLRLIADGRLHDSIPVTDAGTREWSITATSPAASWYVVELRARDGAMLALTNPIFFDR